LLHGLAATLPDRGLPALSDEPDHSSPRPARIAWAAALAAFLPFAALAAALLATGRTSAMSGLLADAFKMWSAIVLAFLGGIRFGLDMRAGPADGRALSIATLAALSGWGAMFLPDAWCIPVLMVAYGAHGAWDSLAAFRGEAPAWFGNLRIVMTLLIVAAHGAAFLALA
jgi:hypothetical protein